MSRISRAAWCRRVLVWAGLLAAGTCGGVAGAQALRDPTEPPPEAGLRPSPPGAVSTRLEPGAGAIIVRDGKPYLVIGTRLYAQGQVLGQARIERIGETEIWLREGGVLRKVPVFSGVHRQLAASAGTPAVARQRASKSKREVPSNVK